MIFRPTTISIVTISLNQGRFLEQAICSVFEQNYDHIEYIVVDPGSKDSSRNIIEKYRSRFAAVIFESDNGPADGLNRGFARASGDICGYLNADDYFEPGAFREVAHFFDQHREMDVLRGAIKIVNEQGRARFRTGIADHFDLTRFVAGVCWTGQQGTFFRRTAFERIGGFQMQNRTCWDAELLVELALAGCRFGTIRKVLGNFRLHSESITGSGSLNAQYAMDMKRIEKRLAGANIRVGPLCGTGMRFVHRMNLLRHIRALTLR